MLAGSARVRQGAVVPKRNPYIWRAPCVREGTRFEALWKNADDLEWNLIQQDRPANCIRITAKTTDPIRITEQHHMPAPRSVLFAQKPAAKIGGGAENLEEVLRDPQTIDNFRSSAVRR